MSTMFVLAIAVRWLTILSMAALIGALALDRFVLPAGAPELLRARDRLRRWCRSCVVALTCATLAELGLRTAIMSGGGVASAFAALPTVLTRTHFGTLWLARLGALAVALVASSLRASSGTVIMMLAAVAVALTSSLTGHAADWGDLSLSVLVDWIHVLAASAWTGGLIGLAFVVAAPRRAWPAAVVGMVARRFSAMAGVCLLVAVSSGIYGGWVEVPAVPALWATAYGRWLLVKVLVVLIIAGHGAVNRYRVLPRLGVEGARARLFTLIGREAGLAIVVFALTAFLTESPPARHAYHVHTGEAGAPTPHDHTTLPPR
jgi:putative copper export protein